MTRIIYTIHTADLLALGYSDADVEVYARKLNSALIVAYPRADICVETVPNVPGASVILVDTDDDKDEDTIREHVRVLAEVL